MGSPDAPLALGPAAAGRYARDLGRALDALRLNRQFPDWERVRDQLAALAATPAGLRVDRASGMPVPREWIRARVEAELAGEHGRALAAREVHVALRNRTGDRASYAVSVDRLDVATGTLARYALVLADAPGRVVSEGELALRAAERFRAKLELLSTQDAALAFAVLRDQEGLDVEEVVRGVIGPAALPDHGCGPPALLPLGGGPILSACLERASLDLVDRRVDDPLADTVVLPASTQPFGLARSRKWAAPEASLAALRAWLAERRSRGLVYAYSPEAG